MLDKNDLDDRLREENVQRVQELHDKFTPSELEAMEGLSQIRTSVLITELIDRSNDYAGVLRNIDMRLQDNPSLLNAIQRGIEKNAADLKALSRQRQSVFWKMLAGATLGVFGLSIIASVWQDQGTQILSTRIDHLQASLEHLAKEQNITLPEKARVTAPQATPLPVVKREVIITPPAKESN